MSHLFDKDPKDRKRRFLQGLNAMLNYESLEDKNIALNRAIRVSVGELRNKLERIYGLEFTKTELKKILLSGISTGDFTEKYCQVIYRSRPKVELNDLISKARDDNQIVDVREFDFTPKYGLNGSEWCDVTEGPCSCGAYHK